MLWLRKSSLSQKYLSYLWHAVKINEVTFCLSVQVLNIWDNEHCPSLILPCDKNNCKCSDLFKHQHPQFYVQTDIGNVKSPVTSSWESFFFYERRLKTRLSSTIPPSPYCSFLGSNQPPKSSNHGNNHARTGVNTKQMKVGSNNLCCFCRFQVPHWIPLPGDLFIESKDFCWILDSVGRIWGWWVQQQTTQIAKIYREFLNTDAETQAAQLCCSYQHSWAAEPFSKWGAQVIVKNL